MLSLRQRLQISVAIALLLIIVAILAVILFLCDGHLIYSLDDPYISLSLGWHIAHGQYGINASEASSPSSSILYPFVLAGFAWASWQEWVPLVVNALAAIGTGVAFAAAACRYGIVTRPAQIVRSTVLIVGLCIAINIVGLVFTGLEHSLHALTSVFVVLCLARTFEEDKVSVPLIVAIVLLPLWRFEGCALALLAVTGLAMVGHGRAALAALCGIVASLAIYMAAMHGMGLPLLPSSVLSKSPIAKDVVDGTPNLLVYLGPILGNAWGSLRREAVPVFVLIALVVAHPVLRSLRPGGPEPQRWSLWREWVFAGVVAGALIAHVLFGPWGSFLRYSAYAVAFGAAGAIVLWRGAIARFVARGSLILDGVALLALLNAGLPYVIETLVTPVAARGIYEQQYQMHRFAVDYYRQPVAVNDLGWVSYGNPNYVLDLLGLGSEAARQARARRPVDPDWVSRLVTAHRIGLVMVYADKFAGLIPPTWQPVAELCAPHYIAPELDTVTFYATSPDAATRALDALRAFNRHKARGISPTIFDQSAVQRATACWRQ